MVSCIHNILTFTIFLHFLHRNGVECQFGFPSQCDSGPCKNGGTCYDSFFGFFCQCRSGYDGAQCENKVLINECLSDPCSNGGTCTDLEEGFLCDCPPSFIGDTCFEDIDECILDRPCQNYIACVNTYGGYECNCLPGFTGIGCETEINECASNPCNFGGTCIDGLDGFSCLCVQGYIGLRCEAVVRSCPVNHPCGEKGSCVERPTGGFTCVCDAGYEGEFCDQEVNECSSSPCLNGGVCEDIIGGYICTCQMGYSGANCEQDISECSSFPCLNQGQCVEPAVNMYQCLCVPGFTGRTCETNIDECASFPCQAFQACVDGYNSYSCKCPAGYAGLDCTELVDKCISNPCQNDGLCLSIGIGYTCTCTYPYSGVNCEIDLDVCEPNPCIYGGTCLYDTRASTGFSCQCPPGFIGERCEGDVHDCLSNPCQNNGSCIENTDGTAGFACQCIEPYKGRMCEVDPRNCKAEPCENNSTCIDMPRQGYLCLCEFGWEGNRCEINVNECLVQQTPCLNGGVCNDTRGSYECDCGVFWTAATCETDVLECESFPCQNNGFCTENKGANYTCLCLPGFNGTSCEVEIDECLSEPCLNNATCINGVGAYVCTCNDGYTGVNCETEIDECLTFPCENEGTCINLPGSYSCLCADGFTGMNCEMNVDDCASQPCVNNATCYDLNNEYYCGCVPGYTGVNCESQINECTVLQPCRNNATCIDGPNTFACVCAPGWTGGVCNVNIDECFSNPCINGLCIDVVNAFVCQCFPGYTGVLCGEDITECTSEPCLNGATCIEPTQGTYQCICPPGVTGNNCQFVNFATFSRNSFLQIPNAQLENLLGSIVGSGVGRKKRDAMNLDIVKAHKDTVNVNNVLKRQKREVSVDRLIAEMTVQTTVLDGILLFYTGENAIGQRTYLALELLDGNKVQLSSDLSGFDLKTSLPVSIQEASNIVLIQLVVSTSSITLVKNPQQCILGNSDCYSVVNIPGGPLPFSTMMVLRNGAMYIGGLPDITPYVRSKVATSEGFLGCLGNIKINNNVLDLGSVTNTVVVNASPGTVSTFPSNTAASNPATNVELSITQVNQPSPANINMTNNTRHPIPGCMTHSPCSESVCSNQAVCVDLWTELQCQCKPGFSGEDCSDLFMFHLHDNTFMHLNIESNDRLITVVDFWITVNNNFASGIVFYTLSAQPLTLYIVGGALRLELVSVAQEVLFTTPVINDGAWRRVTIFVGRNDVQFEVSEKSGDNPEFSDRKFVPGIVVVEFPMFWGQLHEDPMATLWRNRILDTSSFNGCVQNITVNQQRFTAQSITASSLGNDPPPPDQGCPREDRCLPDPCEPSGSCEGGWDNYTCECVADFSGNNCKDVSASTYDGVTSYVEVTLDTRVFPFGDSGYFQFRTQEPSGRLMYIQLKTSQGLATSFVEFLVFNGILQVTASFGLAQTVTIPSSGNVPVNNGTWHSVAWKAASGVLAVTLNSRPEWQATIQGVTFQAQDQSPLVTVFVGARPFQPGINNMIGYFKGCIQDIRFNEQQLLYLSEPPPAGLAVNKVAITTSCLSSNTCLNNDCSVNAFCEELWNTYRCVCLEGWENPPACDVSSNDCVNHNCKNGAQCIDQHLSYTCQCISGYTGEFCEDVIQGCDVNPCAMNNTQFCTSLFPLDYFCLCKDGWAGKNCEVNINECESQPCLNGATCIDEVAGYACICRQFYYGDFCESISLCASQPCYNGGTCFGDFITNRYTCNCSRFYIGQQCQTLNTCLANDCQNNATCIIRDENQYNCSCPDGFYGDKCELTDSCASNPCLNRAISCTNVGFMDDYSCVCIEHYTGKSCEMPINKCEVNQCLNGGSCFFNASDPEKASSCLCPDGYQSRLCEVDVDECLSNPCQNNGSCIENSRLVGGDILELIPGFRCECKPGFTSTLCMIDIDECESNPCLNSGQCSNQINGYLCSCPQFYGGLNCETDMRGCTSDPCQNGANCVDYGNSTYMCNCRNGFTGEFCDRNIDDCQEDSCVNGGVCQDVVDGFLCVCPPGYSGQFCEIIINSCFSGPCLNSGLCNYIGKCSCIDVVVRCGWFDEECQERQCKERPGCFVNYLSYICNCDLTGFQGTLCEEDIDECIMMPGSCLNGGRCVNAMGTFRCDCTGTGYEGNFCNNDLNECELLQEPCFNGGVCLNLPSSYGCLCRDGWKGQECGQKVDMCSIRMADVCQNGGVCENIEESPAYRCDCVGTGYQGYTCAEKINECETGSERCSEQGTCIDEEPGYSCACTANFTGQFCESRISTEPLRQSRGESWFDDFAIMAILITIVVILILVFIVTVISCFCMKKKNRYNGRYLPSSSVRQRPTASIEEMVERSSDEALI